MAMQDRDKINLKEELNSLEKQIDQCRILYELYFSGIEKREPLWHRQEIVRVFTVLQRHQGRGSSIERFRLRGLKARFTSLSQKWDRINLQREKGTYYKDKARARRHLGIAEKQSLREALQEPAADTSDTDEHPTVYSLQDLEKPDLGASERKSSRAASASATASEKSSREKGRLTEERCQKIYRTYLTAKKRCVESVDKVSYDAVVKSIRKQVPRLQEKGYRDIDFKVVIRGGKAALKPVGKKS